MKKLFSLVLAVAMVLSMACFASAEENTTLTIVAWDVGTTPYYQAQKEAFEATHPGVTIEYVDVASQDWDTKLARCFPAATPATCSWLSRTSTS